MSGLKKIISRTDTSQSLLNMAVYQEKMVHTGQLKLLEAHKNACSAWSQYSESESNPAVQHLLGQVNTMHQMWLRAQEEFVQQKCICAAKGIQVEKYGSYRNYFLEVLKGERAVTDLEKTVADFEPKINKVQKQLDSVTAKGKDRKCETLTLELGKHLSLKQNAEKELASRKENHELFKLHTIKNAVKLMTDSQIKLHEKCHEIFQTQRLVLDYYIATTYTSMTPQHLLQAKSNSETLLADLRRKLELDGQDSSPSDCGPSQEILDEVVLGNLADIFGGPPLMQNLEIDQEDQATYNPIPDLDPKLHLKPRNMSKEKHRKSDRPLPKTPTEQTPNPPPILTHASGNAPPPIPPRKDLKCNTVPDEDSPEYLAMEGTDDTHDNSVYQSAGDGSSYYLLAQAHSGSKNNSIKSQGSTGSRNDSGFVSRGSSKSESSQQEEEVYEILDSRFSRNPHERDDVYEL